MLKEFKEFAMKGNMLDMAVGIVLGAAFGTIIKSLVADIIMPPIGFIAQSMHVMKLQCWQTSAMPFNASGPPVIILPFGKYFTFSIWLHSPQGTLSPFR